LKQVELADNNNSLNFNVRKKSIKKINEQNLRFASKLSLVKPKVVSKDELENFQNTV
jgi:hypothetical protein